MKKKRRTYQKPSIERIKIDKRITLIMQTPPQDLDPRGSKGSGDSDSPFDGDKPFG